ncbi:MAG: membrane integrity-associated transporter subunit PqiC [Gammaproteobacteria bacterium]|nr:membrane integrity-associated transporter subunit PqiC [Gammaproteobacteria bacterium]
MKYTVILMILFVAGCAGTLSSTRENPALKQYLLRSGEQARFSVMNPVAVTGIGAVTVASYIDGLGLVLETAEGEVREARDHQWAEPLRESLRTFLALEISTQAGQVIPSKRYGEVNWQRRIDVRVDELHGTAEGEARLVAYWHTFDVESRTVVSHNGFEETVALSRDGYGALVKAETFLLERLAVAIAASLNAGPAVE